MKTRYIFAATAASILLTGCFQDVHEIVPGKDVGYVFPELSWANPSDTGTEIHDLLVVVDGGGESYTRHYTSVKEFANEPLDVPAGEYDILVLANATEADGYQVSGLPATKTWGGCELRIITPGSGKTLPPANCFVGGNEGTVELHHMNGPAIFLDPALSSMSIFMFNIPKGISVSVAVRNPAASISLLAEEGGRLEPSVEEGGVLDIGYLREGVIESLVPPTVNGSLTCDLTLTITDSGGTSGSKTQHAAESSHVIKMTAPRMDCGKRYTLAIDYADLVHVLSLGSDTITINDWTSQGDPIGGEVFKPAA